MKGIIREIAKFYNFYFAFWGFYFSAGCFLYNKIDKSFQLSFIIN